MARNVIKWEETGKQLLRSAGSYRDLYSPELDQLHDILEDKGALDALLTAFYFGAAVGAAQERANSKK